jgi:hypothetical protein
MNRHGVAIFVDEYDKPFLETIGKEALQESYRKILKEFYSVLNTQDKYIRFVYITGVTKYGKKAIFSGIDKLNDISMDERFSYICGITEEELHANFDTSVEELAKHNDLTKEECYAKLKKEYDGYHFNQYSKGVYNSFGLLLVLNTMRFGDYWLQTGTPSMFVELFRNNGYYLNKLDNEEATADMLDDVSNAD